MAGKFEPNWWQWPEASAEPGQSVAVVGAGLAGCWAARLLAVSGLNVQLFEAEAEPARGASGNPRGVLYPMLAAEPDPLPRFWFEAFRIALDQLHRLAAVAGDEGSSFGWRREGLLLVPTRKPAQVRHGIAGWMSELGRVLEADEAESLTGLASVQSLILLEQCGTLRPAALCRVLLAHERIRFEASKEVQALEPHGGKWRIRVADGTSSGDFAAVVIANAQAAQRLEHCRGLPLIQSRGQITYLSAAELAAASPLPRCGEGYWIPPQAPGEDHLIGASYRRCERAEKQAACGEPDPDEQLEILRRAAALPGFQLPGPAENQPVRGRVSFRCESPDHAPIIGPLVDEHPFAREFAGLRSGNPRAHYPRPSVHPGLYVSLAHGSRGTLSCPTAAVWITASILGRKGPEPAWQKLVHPARFLVKVMKTGAD